MLLIGVLKGFLMLSCAGKSKRIRTSHGAQNEIAKVGTAGGNADYTSLLRPTTCCPEEHAFSKVWRIRVYWRVCAAFRNSRRALYCHSIPCVARAISTSQPVSG